MRSSENNFAEPVAEDLQPTPIPPQAAGGASSRQRFPAWQWERAVRLHRQFKRVEARRKKVGSVRGCLRRFAWYWDGGKYRTDADRPVRFALKNLVGLFYHWRNHGRTAEALLLRYRPGRTSKVTRALLMDFVSLCRQEGVYSLSQAYRYAAEAHVQLWDGPGATPRYPSRAALLHALSAAQRRAIIDLQGANKAAAQARTAANRILQFG